MNEAGRFAGRARALQRAGFWALAACVAVLSLVPGSSLPDQGPFLLWDKAQHALGFAALAAWGLLAYPQRPWQVLLGLLAFGAAIELAQACTPWRQADARDWLADAVGVALGAALAWRPRRRLL